MKKWVVLMFICLSGSAGVLDKFPDGKITVRVIDEKGNPIENVNAGIGIYFPKTSNPWDGLDGKSINEKTDKSGCVTIDFNALSQVTIGAAMGLDANGYYKSYKDYNFKSIKDGKRQPWNPTVDIVLRKKINPAPMFVKNLSIKALKIPVKNEPAGYDLIADDWVKPYGRGERSDISFALSVERQDNFTFKYRLEMKANPNGDGFCPISKENIVSESVFKLPYEAPETGYVDKIIIQRDVIGGRVVNVVEPEAENYFIRIRTELDESGNVKRAMFGKLVGPIECLPFIGNNGAVVFTYYINPDFTRNTEWDSSKNLFIPPGVNRHLEKYRDYP